MKRIRTGSFEAHLDNGKVAQVEYTSEFIRWGLYENTLISCTYMGVEIADVFRFNNGCTDIPYSIWKAMENNAEHLWETETTLN